MIKGTIIPIVGTLFFGFCLEVIGAVLLLQKDARQIAGFIFIMVGICVSLYMPTDWLFWWAIR